MFRFMPAALAVFAVVCVPEAGAQPFPSGGQPAVPKLDFGKIQAKPQPRKVMAPAPGGGGPQPVVQMPLFASAQTGYLHEYGAFAIGDFSSGMFSLTTPFLGPKFYNVPLDYYAPYTIPFIGPGTIYRTTINPTPMQTVTRYFFFGSQPLPGDRRWVVYFNEDGTPTYQTQARFFLGASGPIPVPGPGPIPAPPAPPVQP